jgi:hypothetical protein
LPRPTLKPCRDANYYSRNFFRFAGRRLLSRLAALERENQGINRDGFRKSHAEDAER